MKIFTLCLLFPKRIFIFESIFSLHFLMEFYFRNCWAVGWINIFKFQSEIRDTFNICMS